MAKLKLLVCMVLITALTKPRKEFLKGIKILYRSLAVQIAVLFSGLSPYFIGAIKEVLRGEVSTVFVIFVVSYLIILFYIAQQFWKVADSCTVMLKK